MTSTFPQTATTSGFDHEPQTKPSASLSKLPMSYSVIEELAVGYSMVIATIAYVIYSSGLIAHESPHFQIAP